MREALGPIPGPSGSLSAPKLSGPIYVGLFGSASAMGTNVSPPSSSAMTTATAPSGLPDLIASAHSSLADFKAWERASSPVGRSEPPATLEEAKAQFQKSWDAWKAWTKLEETS